MAGLDGIQNKIHPGDPLDRDLYDLEPEELDTIDSTPASLAESLDALEDDHEYLLKGDVITQDVIDTWIDYKRETRLMRSMYVRIHTSSISTTIFNSTSCSMVAARFAAT